ARVDEFRIPRAVSRLWRTDRRFARTKHRTRPQGNCIEVRGRRDHRTLNVGFGIDQVIAALAGEGTIASRCSMKNAYLFALGIVAALLLLGGNVEARAAGCDAIGNVRFICDQLGPEDLAPVPGSDWVLSSGQTANGSIRVVNLRDKTTTVLFPSAASRERLNRKIYDSCPGPIGSEGDKFRAHGLYLRAGTNAVHTLYVVHHGDRESIEVFEFDSRGKPPTLTWIGCAIAPDPIGLNSVVGLADGGCITSNLSPRTGDAARCARILS